MVPREMFRVWLAPRSGGGRMVRAAPDRVDRAGRCVASEAGLMAGRHSKRRRAHVQLPAQRGPRPVHITDAVGITDARTRVEHLMTDVSAMQHRHSGRYLALCGLEVLAASLAEREHSHCQPCREQATAPGGRPALSRERGR